MAQRHIRAVALDSRFTSVAAGFLVYDFVFIPPYYTLTVGAAQNWVALGVYAVVMLLVAQVVARLESNPIVPRSLHVCASSAAFGSS